MKRSWTEHKKEQQTAGNQKIEAGTKQDNKVVGVPGQARRDEKQVRDLKRDDKRGKDPR